MGRAGIRLVSCVLLILALAALPYRASSQASPGPICDAGSYSCATSGLTAPQYLAGSQCCKFNSTCCGSLCCTHQSSCVNGYCMFYNDDYASQVPADAQCFASDTRVTRCTPGAGAGGPFVALGASVVSDITPGDGLVSVADDGTPVCSEVYYTFAHPGAGRLVRLGLRLESESGVGAAPRLSVSTAHLVFRATRGLESLFGAHRAAVAAASVAPGDILFVANPSSHATARVTSVAAGSGPLTSVLTANGRVVASGVIVSTHAYDETLHRALFWPLRAAHAVFGPGLLRAKPVVAALSAVDRAWQALGHGPAMAWLARATG